MMLRNDHSFDSLILSVPSIIIVMMMMMMMMIMMVIPLNGYHYYHLIRSVEYEQGQQGPS